MSPKRVRGIADRVKSSGRTVYRSATYSLVRRRSGSRCLLFPGARVMIGLRWAVTFFFFLLALGRSSGTEILDSFGEREEDDSDVRVVRIMRPDGSPARTVILPRRRSPAANHLETDKFYGPVPDNYVLLSESSGRPPGAARGSHVRNKTSLLGGNLADGNAVVRRRKKKKVPSGALVGTPVGTPTDTHKGYNPDGERKNPKFLNLFTIIRFANEACSEGGGTCFHEMECSGLGGIARGTCARGYGVCCYLEASCGDRTGVSGSVFIGGPQLGACSYTIDKLHCTKQIRLDFLQLELMHPNEGNCVNEKFLVTGANKNFIVPELCGSNTGGHMYLDVDETSGPIILSVVSSQANPFRIKVRQLCSGDPLLAPKHCLQFYAAQKGTISSFNYVPPPLRSTYMNNLNYAICIRKEAGSCSIVYTNVPLNGTEYPFEINNIDPDDGTPTVPSGQAGAEVFNCPDDYITIGSIRLCGQKLNDASVQVDFTKNYPVTDTSQGPFIIGVRTDKAISGRGFRIDYEQKPC